MTDDTMNDTFRLNLPKDLLSEAARQSKAKPNKGPQLRVDGFRTSWLSRLSEVLVGKD